MRGATFTIHGARGSQPVSGKAFQRYGGYTSCYSLKTPSGLIVLDAGSGIASLGRVLAQQRNFPAIDIFFTHVHLDHILGLPAFEPLYRRGAKITLWGDGTRSGKWIEAIRAVMGRPIWPVSIREAGAAVSFQNLPWRQSHLMRYGVDVSWCRLEHPQSSVSYKLRTDGRTLVLATDREHGNKKMDSAFLDFCRGADILIHDAQYLPAEYRRKYHGWGHSTWKDVARLAKEASVQELILTHHDPRREDRNIDAIVRQAKRIFSRTRAAGEDMVLMR